MSSMHVFWFIFEDWAVTLAITFMSCTIEWRSLAASRARAKAQTANQSKDTIYSVLGALCDAVLWLGPDFKILSGSASLSALLLKHTSAIEFFPDVIEEADRQQFSVFAANTRNHTCSTAASLHVSMRDAAGILVQTQIFLASLKESDSSYKYVVGIREHSREEDELGAAIAGNVAPPAAPRALQQDPIATSTSVGSNHSSDVSIYSPPAHIEYDPLEVSVTFNVFSFIISDASAAFIGIGGPACIGANLLTILGDTKDIFGRFVQNLVASKISGKDVHAYFGVLSFRTPLGQLVRLEYHAECSLDLFWCHRVDVPYDEMSIRIILANVSERRCKRVSHSRRPRRSNSDSVLGGMIHL